MARTTIALSDIRAEARKITQAALAAQKQETAKDDRAYQQGIRHGAEALFEAIKNI